MCSKKFFLLFQINPPINELPECLRRLKGINIISEDLMLH
jgi:hypothetical protein